MPKNSPVQALNSKIRCSTFAWFSLKTGYLKNKRSVKSVTSTNSNKIWRETNSSTVAYPSPRSVEPCYTRCCSTSSNIEASCTTRSTWFASTASKTEFPLSWSPMSVLTSKNTEHSKVKPILTRKSLTTHCGSTGVLSSRSKRSPDILRRALTFTQTWWRAWLNRGSWIGFLDNLTFSQFLIETNLVHDPPILRKIAKSPPSVANASICSERLSGTSNTQGMKTKRVVLKTIPVILTAVINFQVVTLAL